MMDILIGFYDAHGVRLMFRTWSYVPSIGDTVLIDGPGECIVKRLLWHTAIDGRAAVDVTVEASNG
jgi:hypothetical protein